MVKTRGKKKKSVIIAIVLLAVTAAVMLSRPGIQSRIRDISREKRSIPQKPALPPAARQKGEQPDTTTTEQAVKPRAKLAIIIDDVGYPSPLIDDYQALHTKITFSILPFQPESVNYAQKLHKAGFEVMIHIPMEPENFPEKDPGQGALYIKDNREDVEHKVGKMMNSIPHASGANNHMGSRATQDNELMLNTLQYLKAEGFYFIDSLTTPHSAAHDIAKNIQMQSAHRDIFLDNYNDAVYIEKQFEQLKSIALERGTAIGIGHIQNEHLLSVLHHQVRTLPEDGLELVFVSELFRN